MELTVKTYWKAKNKSEIKDTYRKSFPKEEQMPFPLMVLLSCLWNTRLLVFYDKDRFCGFVYMASIGRQSYIMFFAVPEQLRSMGYGSKILHRVQAMYPQNKMIVSIEPCEGEVPDKKLRISRRAFYIRNGYKRSGFMMKLAGQVQEILVANGEFNKKSFILFFIMYSSCTIIPKVWKAELQKEGE